MSDNTEKFTLQVDKLQRQHKLMFDALSELVGFSTVEELNGVIAVLTMAKNQFGDEDGNIEKGLKCANVLLGVLNEG